MTIEYAAFAVGVFLVVATLIWKRLRFIERRVRKMQDQINALHTIESRLFMIALSARPKAENPDAGPHNMASLETNAGKVASEDSEHQLTGADAGPPIAEGHTLGAELTPLVPLARRSGAEQEVGTPANPFEAGKPLPAPPLKSNP